MKTTQSAMAAVVLFVAFATTTFAQEYPKPTGYVNDFARLLSQEQGSSLNHALVTFEEKTTIEIAVVTIDSLNGESIEDYTSGLATSWGVGKGGQNNGIVFLIAPKERKMRIETASGVRSILTDKLADEIRDTVVLPRFKAGKMSEGIVSGTHAIMRAVEVGQAQERQPPVSPEVVPGDRKVGLYVLVAVFLCFFGSIVYLPIGLFFKLRRSVLKDLIIFPERLSEVENQTKHRDVKEETRNEVVGLREEFALINRQRGKISWSDMRDKLDALDYNINELVSAIENDIAFADEAREEGPKLMKEIPGIIKAAEAEISKGKRSKEARRHLEEARKQYSYAQKQKSGMTLTDWVVLYVLLNSAKSEAATAVSKHEYANGDHSSRSSSSSSWSDRSSSSHGYGSSSGFGGGAGFGFSGGGGGSSGSW